jgi:hypothetical protein
LDLIGVIAELSPWPLSKDLISAYRIEDDDQLAVFSFIYLQNTPGGLYISELI